MKEEEQKGEKKGKAESNAEEAETERENTGVVSKQRKNNKTSISVSKKKTCEWSLHLSQNGGEEGGGEGGSSVHMYRCIPTMLGITCFTRRCAQRVRQTCRGSATLRIKQ
jgi:hypothetical protein